MLSLPAFQYFIDHGVETYLIARSKIQSDLAVRIGVDGYCDEIDYAIDSNPGGGSELLDGITINLRYHPVQTNYWWGSEKFARDYPSYKINDILATICRDYGFCPDFNDLTKLRFDEVPGLSKTVVLIPGSDGPHKLWNKRGWIRLSELTMEQGFDVIVLGQPECSAAVLELIDAGIPWRATPAVGDAVDVLSSCAAAIGLDTGLTHIATQQHIPTVFLTKSNPIYIRPQEYVAVIESARCQEACDKKFLEGATNEIVDFNDPAAGFKSWDCVAPESQRCMTAITPDAVLAKLQSLVPARRS
ncbi:MAG: glycosyltransferase family 9 protein, partial [bacterium]